jgi:4-hydroxy-3-methylbut-2-enyl diphosphate reductase
MTRTTIDLLLANPRGFCAGVERAIDIVERALILHGAPVYVRHEIVHNKRVVETLRQKGARFVAEIDEVPVGAVTVFSAHGVARRVEEDAMGRKLQILDATCPLVAKVHHEGQRYAALGYEIILIGHEGHPEVTGTLGRIPAPVKVVSSAEDVAELNVKRPDRLAYITQTTLSVHDTQDIINALRARFPGITGPDTRDICYATQNRQNAVLAMAGKVDLLLVVGASNSSNSARLRELGETCGLPSYLIASADDLRREWFGDIGRAGLTAGASAPEVIVREVTERLSEWFEVNVQSLPGKTEEVHFKLPPELASYPKSPQPAL